MLLSMTGYGRAQGTFKDKTVVVELRSLNSKFSDVRLKLPQSYREKEVSLRKLVSDQVSRGKIDVTVDFKSANGSEEYSLNKALFTRYYQELSDLASSLDTPKGDLVQTILRIPNVIASGASEVEEEEWDFLNSVLNDAIGNFKQFRADEGKAMEKDLRERISSIRTFLKAIEPFEKERIPKIRQRMMNNLEEFLGKENVDKNRFEQEVLFYIEKIDINEEKVRLEQHCAYFLEELSSSETQKGRKLSFIGQEMGREINTLGSKAYSSDIQRYVVKMKDELEKIKEQVANSV